MIVRSDSAQTNSTRREYFVASRVLPLSGIHAGAQLSSSVNSEGLNEQLR